MRLVKPSAKYKKNFLAATKEERGTVTGKNFAAFLEKMDSYEKGRKLPKHWVPAKYRWLIDRSEFIGETTIRLRLNSALLKRGGHIGYGIRPTKRRMGYGKKVLALALKEARKSGIKRVLITCDDSNTASWKIIEANGGKLKNTIRYEGVLVRRYWIQLK